MLGIDSIAQLATDVIDKIWPSPEDESKRMEAKAKLLEAQQKGELAQLQIMWDNANKQLEVAKAEAENNSRWVSGWRPGVGWACAAAFAYNFVLAPFSAAIVHIWYPAYVLPELDLSQMLPVLLGMLGLGAYHSFDAHSIRKDKKK